MRFNGIFMDQMNVAGIRVPWNGNAIRVAGWYAILLLLVFFIYSLCFYFAILERPAAH